MASHQILVSSYFKLIFLFFVTHCSFFYVAYQIHNVPFCCQMARAWFKIYNDGKVLKRFIAEFTGFV